MTSLGFEELLVVVVVLVLVITIEHVGWGRGPVWTMTFMLMVFTISSINRQTPHGESRLATTTSSSLTIQYNSRRFCFICLLVRWTAEYVYFATHLTLSVALSTGNITAHFGLVLILGSLGRPLFRSCFRHIVGAVPTPVHTAIPGLDCTTYSL